MYTRGKKTRARRPCCGLDTSPHVLPPTTCTIKVKRPIEGNLNEMLDVRPMTSLSLSITGSGWNTYFLELMFKSICAVSNGTYTVAQTHDRSTEHSQHHGRLARLLTRPTLVLHDDN